MPTIKEIRQKYPQYNDMTDTELASALHKKYYNDMPEDEYYNKIGVGKEMQPDMSIGERALDIGKGIVETPLAIASGMVGGLAGLAGSIGAGIAGESPEEAKKFREYIQQQYSYQPESESAKGALNIVGTALSPLSIPREIGESFGGEQWGNVGDVAMLGLAPKIPGALKKAGEIPYNSGKSLYRKTLQPKGNIKTSGKLTDFGYERGYGSTTKDVNRFYRDLTDLHRQANQVLAGVEGSTIPANKIISFMDDAVQYAKKTELPITHVKALERMKAQRLEQWMNDYPTGNIPVSEVQKFKTTLYDRGANTYGEIQKAMSSEGRKALARGARIAIEDVVPELGPINRKMKPLLEFEESLNDSVTRIKNEKFSITNTIFNNDLLLGKLAKVFKAISPKHPLASREAVKAYMFAKKNVDFDEAFQKPPDTSYVKGVPGQYIGYEGKFTGDIPISRQRKIGYDPNSYKQRQIGYDWKAEANRPADAVLVDPMEGRFRGKGLTPDIWSKNPAKYPVDIQDIVGMRKGKIQVENELLSEILRRLSNK